MVPSGSFSILRFPSTSVYLQVNMDSVTLFSYNYIKKKHLYLFSLVWSPRPPAFLPGQRPGLAHSGLLATSPPRRAYRGCTEAGRGVLVSARSCLYVTVRSMESDFWMAVWLDLGDWQISMLKAQRSGQRSLCVHALPGQAGRSAVSNTLAEGQCSTVRTGPAHNPTYSLLLGRMFVAGS